MSEHIIEAAKSGRAACRACKEKIEKDSLRFGLVIEEPYPSTRWFHLPCGAEKQALQFIPTLEAYDGEVPDREALLATASANRKKQKPAAFPYAEKAPSARSACLVCSEKIAKDSIRVAIEREVEMGGSTRTSAGYLHPACCSGHDDCEDSEALFEAIAENSTALEEDEIEALADDLG